MQIVRIAKNTHAHTTHTHRLMTQIDAVNRLSVHLLNPSTLVLLLVQHLRLNISLDAHETFPVLQVHLACCPNQLVDRGVPL